MAGIDEIKDEYEPRIQELLDEISVEARSRGYTASEPIDQADEEYWWYIFVIPKGEDEQEGVDVKITIAESGVRGDEDGGLNFALDVTSYEGEIIGSLTPYNYTPDVWVPMDDEDAVEARWNLFSNGIDADPIVDSIDEFIKRRQATSPHRPAFSPADLDLINRHRARFGQAPLDPIAAGWEPQDVIVEAQRIRALNPRPRVSVGQAVGSALLSTIGVAGIVFGRRKR